MPEGRTGTAWEPLKVTNKLRGLSLRANIPTERLPLVGKVNANFYGYRVSHVQRNGRILGFLERGRYFFFK
jgi:hypothetical protein